MSISICLFSDICFYNDYLKVAKFDVGIFIEETAAVIVLHSDIMACKWRQKVSEFLEDKASSNDSVAKVFSHIETLLDSLQYPEHVRHCSTEIDAAIQNRSVF